MTKFTPLFSRVAAWTMPKAVLRGLVPAVGAAALLGLVLAPEAAWAQGDECGAASGGTAMCGPTTGDFDSGIIYHVSDADGLTLTIQQRENDAARTITHQQRTNDDQVGHGIAIYGIHGNGKGLHLVVEGDTTLVRRSSQTVSSYDGIHVENDNSSTNEEMTGSVTVKVGDEVNIGSTDNPFDRHGINAVVNEGPSSTTMMPDLGTMSNAGISINNAGTIHAKERGIRALGRGIKAMVDPTSTHLNGRVEVIHSGSVNAGSWGINAVSTRNADVAVTVEAGGMVTSGTSDGGIFAQTEGTAGPGGSGNVMVTSAGTINATNGKGIEAVVASGDGTLLVDITGGEVTGSGRGIHARSPSTDAGDTTIKVAAGASVTGGTHGIQAIHNSGTAMVNIEVAGTVIGGDGEFNAAISISAADAGALTPSMVTLRDEFRINGDIRFDGGEDDTLMLTVAENMRGEVMGDIFAVETLTKRGPGTAELHGNVTFAGSTLEIQEGVLDLRNELDLGGGTLMLDVAKGMRGEVMGNIMNVDGLTKSSPGTARLNGDVALSGSAATIEDGLLILRGHLNLGTSGTLTVNDGAKLAVEVADDKADGTLDHGRMTVGTVSFRQSGVLQSGGMNKLGVIPLGKERPKNFHPFVGPDGKTPDPTPPSVDLEVLDENGKLVEGGECKMAGDGAVMCKSPDPTTRQPITTPPITTPPGTTPSTSGSGSDSSNNEKGFVVVSGTALAFMLSNIFEIGAAMGWSEDAGVWPGTAAHGFSSVRPGNRPDAKGLEYQVRLLDGDMPSPGMTAPVSAMSAAVRAHLGGGFHTELSATPKLAADGGRDAVSGSRYGLGLGWRSGVLSTDIGYSHAALDARSTFSNLEGLGELSGSYGLRHDQLQANAKLDLDAGGMKVSPSVSLFGGKVSQDGYTASSRVWLSEVPSVSQEYAGWKAGLTMGSRSPLKGMGLRWRPELRLTTMRLASGGGAGEMELVQRDRAGALRMQTSARASLPRTVHALGSGVTVAGGESWSVRGGYVALVADGEFEHAAGARFRLRF